MFVISERLIAHPVYCLKI